MEDTQFSRTALVTAYSRGYHAQHGNPKVFDDYLAFTLLGEEKQEGVEQQYFNILQAVNPTLTAPGNDPQAALAWVMLAASNLSLAVSRARYSEDSLKEAVRKGVAQYLILGAGFDTFAFRCPKMLEQIQVFEVDHPATQEYKKHRIAQVGWKLPEQLHFIPVEFERENLGEALSHSSYNPQIPTFFSWLGVTVYLPREAVFSTLRTIAACAAPGSEVIFDYYDVEAFVPGKASKQVQIWMANSLRLGEPMITGFEPDTLETDLAELGFDLQENLSPAEIESRYFQGRTDGYHATAHMNIARAIVK